MQRWYTSPVPTIPEELLEERRRPPGQLPELPAEGPRLSAGAFAAAVGTAVVVIVAAVLIRLALQ